MIQEDRVRVVREFTGTIINPFDRDELLHRLMGHATRVVSATGAGVMLAGIVMARANVDADTAFEMLREQSQNRNEKLRDLAEHVVQQHEARAGSS